MPRTYNPPARCGVNGCGRKHKANGLCGMHDDRRRKHGDPLYEWDGLRPERRATAEKFWSRVNPNGPTRPHMTTACAEWTGPPDQKGYGTTRVRGFLERTHRAAWLWTHGSIPDGLCVCHHCDNPACVRIDHLWLGTVADNNNDRDRKGRNGCMTGTWHGPRRPIRGEGSRHGRLTAANVDEIRTMLEDGSRSMRAIAAVFGLRHQAISKIASGQSWALANDDETLQLPALPDAR